MRVVVKTFYIDTLSLKYIPIVYTKSNLSVPYEDTIFKQYQQIWSKHANNSSNNFYDKSKIYYIAEKSVGNSRRSLMVYNTKCILKKKVDYVFPAKNEIFDFYTNVTVIPDTSQADIIHFYDCVHADLKERYLDFDAIVPEKKQRVKTEKDNDYVYAKVNGNRKKENYYIKNLQKRYIFVTSEQEEYEEIMRYINNTISFKICSVIFTAKCNHKLFDNKITLDEWFKTDMFKTIFKRMSNSMYLNNLEQHNLKNYLWEYNKDLYYNIKDYRAKVYNSNIINMGNTLGINPNIAKMPIIDRINEFHISVFNKIKNISRLKVMNNHYKNKIERLCRKLN